MDQSRRQARLERNRAQQRRGQLRWLVYISIAAVAVVGLLILSNMGRSASIREYASAQTGALLGDPDAPVTLIEYADFQCSFCRQSWATTEEAIVKQYVDTGQINYQFVILAILGPESVQAAEAAYCAAEQNKFWEFHDAVFGSFSSQNSGGYSDSNLADFAQAAGLDMNAYNECVASDVKLQAVEQAALDARAIGVDSTPTFQINDQIVAGAQPLSMLQSMIEDALAAVGAD